eukprot:Gregarina_sp_Pseudo_9__1756@NODE_2193_length_1105_cov_13_131332_g2021_i0_p1_GENE_NODE_2193_length_1105_cov_13_131332_g2021_i0NODE_2193_length_1105_cov_13_131332_g2021_i0_p1_ORF_typecomplete_len338_score29_18zfCCCH_2/PF14608_6/0_00075zfCCCH_2/PF14608_6/0_0029zfCCCH_2/PF14608_6/0_013zfCCCH_4/PF18044_1/0_00011zfCCCH_4/PF18044_1/0_043zfCCCH_4/PF18044_1/56zfCCCH_4/PF18044_1/2_5e02PWI/PF01480_17/9_9e07zfCCCH/PF00642_24/0_00056zfCCCH/PF00642_24/0_26zfCCCH/PF00642_24/1_3e02zfCCCH/PF00642_24/1_7e02Nab2/P
MSECRVSESTSQRCQAAITDRLASMLGEDGVEILTEYIWHMITRPKTTKEHVCSELREFLGTETDAFVEWLIQAVGPAVARELYDPNAAQQQSRVQMEELHHPSTADASSMAEPPTSSRPSSQQHQSISRRVKYERSEERQPISQPVPPPPVALPPPPPTFQTMSEPQQASPQQQPAAAPGAQVAPLVTQVFVDPDTGVPMQLVPVPLGSQKLGILSGKKLKKRCARYPNCPFGDECRYIHPSEMCLNWPRCTFGPDCFYIHPEVPCKYGVNCLNWACNYSHPKERNLEAMQSRYNAYTGTFRNQTLTCVDPSTQPSHPTASEQEIPQQQQQQQPQS